MKLGKTIIIIITLIMGMASNQSALANREDGFEKFGDVAQFGVPVAAALVSLYHEDYKGLFQLGEGTLYTSIATHGLKFAINAERPNGGTHSFPSGHTAAATQGAAYLQFRYGWKYGVPAYAVSALVGYSRVDSNHHYWRDVAAGMVLATAIQYVVTEMGYSMSNYMFAPYFNDDAVGLMVNVRW